MRLTENEKKKIIDLIKDGKRLPPLYRPLLFTSDDTEYIEATKDYKLVYKGKARKEEILANTPAAPLQKVRTFNSNNTFDDNWSNMLIFGDNLLALKTLYEDQKGADIYKTKNKIKLIYIDPPFATRQDFMKDREKAYRDKIIGSQFIEFLRKRLIFLKEILADDGSIYVHLDWKKGHYVKAIMDEVFGEHNFLNEIIWQRTTNTGSSKALASKLSSDTDSIFLYTKEKNYVFNKLYRDYGKGYLKRFKYEDENGLYRWSAMKTYSQEKYNELNGKGMIRWGENAQYPEVKQYLHDLKGVIMNNLWNDIFHINPMAKELIDYPTQKPELLLERVIRISSNENDIVLDAFVGSGTTPAVAEKLNRRWIGIDCGKLSIYTTQKRMLSLSTQIGPEKKDERREHGRTEGFENHSKNSRGLLLVYEKARKGELIISDSFLINLASFISSYLKGNKTEKISIICPEEKFKVEKSEVIEDENEKVGDKIIQVGRIKFLISFIQPKEKLEKKQNLNAKEFTLYNVGIYDNNHILEMDWKYYKSFVINLFGVREYHHKIHGFVADGYIGTNSAFIWDYPNQKNLVLDYKYVQTLHDVLGGKAGDNFYIIAPVVSMGFMEDSKKIGNTTYIFLKVPLSVLKALIKKGVPGSLKQPVKESDVNEVIDAIGYDFISQPVVEAKYHRTSPQNVDLFNSKDKDYIIEITKFKSNTLVYDPEDFENFETFSMALVDLNYNGDCFKLDKTFWSDEILNDDRNKAIIRIGDVDFIGEKMMVIFVDKYGNECKITKTKEDFK